MKYRIVRSRGLFIVYEEDKIIKYYYTYQDADEFILRTKYIEMVYFIMNDY
jgi:hypothetical protein